MGEATAKRFEKMGKPVPDSFKEPEIELEDIFYLRAFLDLQHDKTQFRSIPWTAINEYGKRHELSLALFESVKEIVTDINNRLEEHFEKQRQREAKRASQETGKAGDKARRRA